MPVSGTCCVPLAASEVTVSISRNAPAVAVGLKVTVTLQSLPGARLTPLQFLDALKRLVPTVAEVILMLAPPSVFFSFFSVTFLLFAFALFSLSKMA
jgi:hypothetical protein